MGRDYAITLPFFEAGLALGVSYAVVCLGIIFGREQLLPIICRVDQKRIEYLRAQIEIAPALNGGDVFVRKRLVVGRKHAFEFIQVEFVAQRYLHVPVAQKRFVHGIEHPRRTRVPIAERIRIGAFHDSGVVAVRIHGRLQCLGEAVRRHGVVFPIGSLAQNEIDISDGRGGDIARVERGRLQVHVGVHGILTAPIGIELTRPHAVKARGGSPRTAQRGISARIIGALRQS